MADLIPRQFALSGRSLIRRLLPFALAAIAIFAVSLAYAAEAWILPYEPKLKERKSEVMKILSDGQAIPADKQATFDDYFTKYALPLFVQKSIVNDTAASRGPAREPHAANKKAFQEYFNSANNGPPRDRLLELSRKAFKAVVAKKLPPDTPENVTARARLNAAKVNAVLALGDLDKAKAGPGTSARPLPEALNDLLNYAKPPDPGKSTSGAFDALRIAAMVGLQRHAESSETSPEAKLEISRRMLAVLKQKTPPPGRDLAVNDLMRARAAAVLGASEPKDPTAVAEAVKELDGVINTPEESVRLRCAAARAMGSLTFSSDTKLDFKPLADHIGHLAVDVCKQQLEHTEQPTLDLATRVRLKTCVSQAVDGVRALLAGATDAGQRQFVDSVAKGLKSLDEQLDKSDLVANLESPLKKLESVLQPGDKKAEKVAGRP